MAQKRITVRKLAIKGAIEYYIEQKCKYIALQYFKSHQGFEDCDNDSGQMDGMFSSIWFWLAHIVVKSGKLPDLPVQQSYLADEIARKYQSFVGNLEEHMSKSEFKNYKASIQEVVDNLSNTVKDVVPKCFDETVMNCIELLESYLEDFYGIISNDDGFNEWVSRNPFKNDQVLIDELITYFSLLGTLKIERGVELKTREQKITRDAYELLCVGGMMEMFTALSAKYSNINEAMNVFKDVYDHNEEKWVDAEYDIINQENEESDDDDDSDDDYEEDDDSDEDYEEDDDSDDDYEEESDDEDSDDDYEEESDDDLPDPIDSDDEDNESSVENLAENYGDDEYLDLIDVRENKKELKEAAEDVAEEIEEENDEELPEGTLSMYTHILKRETLILNFASAKWLSENKHFINTCKKYKLDSQSLGLLILHYIYNLLIQSNLTPLKLAGYRKDLTIPKNYAEFATKTVLNMMNSLAEHVVTKASIKAGYTAEVPIKLADKIAEPLVSHVKKTLGKLYDETHKNFMGLIDLAASQINPNEAKAFAKKLRIKPTKDFISTYARMQATWVVGTYFYVTNFANDWTYEKDNMELSTNVKINVLFEFVYHYRRETNKQIAKLFKGATPEEIDELFNKEYLKHADKYNATIFKMLNSGGDDVLKRFKAKMAKMK